MNRYRRIMRSLRFRLLLGTVITSFLILGLLGISIYYSIRRALVLDFDDVSLAKAQTLAVTAEHNGSNTRFEFEPGQMPEFAAGLHRPEYFQAWSHDGKTILRSASLGAGDLGAITTPGVDDRLDGTLPDGRAGRFLTYKFYPRTESTLHKVVDPIWVRIGRDTRALRHNLDELRLLLFGLCASAMVLTGLVLLWVVNRGLLPAENLARRIDMFRETDFAQRFDVESVPPELASIVSRLNRLLDRLQVAFDQEKAFTADVAHELRTPLAGLRATLQVCRSRPRDRAAYETAIDSALQINDQMTEMVEKLLLLARADAGQLKMSSSVFDARELVLECWQPLDVIARERSLHVDFRFPDQADVQTDRHAIRIVLQNLLTNAVAYADDGGSVSMEVKASLKATTINISNSGSRIAPEDVPSLTRRFWRKDASRSWTEMHCGLGISICERLVAGLSGKMTVRSAVGGLFEVQVETPNMPVQKSV
jgi:signal transduction histidine kinase